jgi:cell fate (sporulation/competence/biofilm development) regulator YlbF (YheA/YmcA/DUF963 family)
MADLMEMARDLGRTMARTDEYQALRRAISMADDDREITELTRHLEALEGRVQEALEQGRRPDEALQNEYETAVSRLQASSTYQRLVAAQSNFDRVVQRVNQTIAQGLEEGAQSRIIIPT